MRKKYIVLAAAIGAALSAMASPVTPEQALERVSDNGMMKGISNVKNYSLNRIESFEGEDGVYLFEDHQGGFIVAPADDVSPAILGYGSAYMKDAQGEIAPEFAWWLKELSRQVAYAKEHPTKIISKVSRPERAPIEPLCKTRWNQMYPYFLLCPMQGDSRCVTGCVATAMAQVMKYHNWPERGTGELSYTYNNQDFYVNLEETPFMWDEMLDEYSWDPYVDSGQSKAAVAELMRCCGYSVKMMYSPGGSGAYSINIPGALANSFKYSKSLQMDYRDFYNLYDWEDKFYLNLQTYGPVIVDGQSYEGGHSFVVDGYSHDGYFHLNWGWGGISDGYFLLDALDPYTQGMGGSASGTGFDFMQDAIFGITPDRDGTSTWTPELRCRGGQYFTYSPTDNAILLQSSIYNASPIAITNGYVGVAYTPIDEEFGDKSIIDAYDFEELPVGYGFKDLDFKVPQLADGTYKIQAICKFSEEADWQIIQSYCYDAQYSILKLDSGSVSVVPMNPEPPVLTDAVFPDRLYVDSRMKFTGKLANESENPFLAYFDIILMDKNNKVVATGRTHVIDLMPGDEVEINYDEPVLKANGARLTKGFYWIAAGVENSYGYELLNEPIKIGYFNTPEPAAINEVATDVCETEAEYFTISGQKAGKGHTPGAPGVYLRKQGNKIEKLIVK